MPDNPFAYAYFHSIWKCWRNLFVVLFVLSVGSRWALNPYLIYPYPSIFALLTAVWMSHIELEHQLASYSRFFRVFNVVDSSWELLLDKAAWFFINMIKLCPHFLSDLIFLEYIISLLLSIFVTLLLCHFLHDIEIFPYVKNFAKPHSFGISLHGFFRNVCQHGLDRLLH